MNYCFSVLFVLKVININTIAFLPTGWAISREDVLGPHRNAVLFATRASP